MTGHKTHHPGIHPTLYDLDHLPDPTEESHHVLIAQHPDTREYLLLEKHVVTHRMGSGITYAYTGWADAGEGAKS